MISFDVMITEQCRLKLIYRQAYAREVAGF